MTDETKRAFKHIGRTIRFHVKGKTKVGAKYTGYWLKQVGKAITSNPNRVD
jgi:hypothetical protein